MAGSMRNTSSMSIHRKDLVMIDFYRSTHYYESKEAAVRYWMNECAGTQGGTVADMLPIIEGHIATGDIRIGPPPLNRYQKLSARGGRYYVCTDYSSKG